jgi:hypothetical protein
MVHRVRREPDRPHHDRRGGYRIPIPTVDTVPSGITAGPDGALWFTESNFTQIGRLSLPLVLRVAPGTNVAAALSTKARMVMSESEASFASCFRRLLRKLSEIASSHQPLALASMRRPALGRRQAGP